MSRLMIQDGTGYAAETRCAGGPHPFRRLRNCLAAALVLFLAAGSLFAADPKLLDAVTKALANTGTLSAPLRVASNAPALSRPAGLAGTNADATLSTNAMAQLDDKYVLAIGDRINFQVVEDQDDPKSIIVTDSGDIEVPYLGRFPAQGKTCQGLANQIKTELEKKYYYQATVVISVDAMLTRGMVYLVGAVRTPGPLEMPRNDVLTISKAILRAGGFTDFADAKGVRVTRQAANGTNEVFVMDVSRVLSKGKTEDDKLAEPGDLIYVPEKTFRF